MPPQPIPPPMSGSHPYTDYRAVEPPAGTDRADYDTDERRAEILGMVERVGTPDALDKTRLADTYDVSRPTIYRDLDRLAEAVEAEPAEEGFRTKALYTKVVNQLLEDDEWRDAWRTHIEYTDWIREREELEALADRIAALEAGDDAEEASPFRVK